MRRALLVTFVFAAATAARADALDALAGKALFERLWVPAPASTDAADGLGPLFNARSCASCHSRGGGARIIDRDGRPEINGAVVRFGKANGAGDPTFGLQLQTHAAPGLASEGVTRFLPALNYSLDGGVLADGVRAGARLAPSLIGRAEFDLVADEEILRRADADDSDSDGVSGRANRTVEGAIGRFGWKSARTSLADQIAHALALDLGLSSPRAPLPAGDCTERQTACLSAPNGESAAFEGCEVSNAMIELMAAYVATLRAPPAKVDASGAALFEKAGCAACHAPELETKNGGRISAFTDLLLHDMGAALDDGVGEPGVASSEWRTAPLISGGASASSRRYLHDGSAATVSEAIAKHGGEGEASRQAFERLGQVGRQRLIDYVMGL